jgi:glucose/mannose-6-phosphate isomerase
VDTQTLFIASSYSGNTEETLSTLNQAVKLNIPTLGITTGGELAKICQKNRLPFYLIDPQFNPSAQPRLALGYAFIGLTGVINKLGFLKVQDEEIQTLISVLTKFDSLWGIKNPKNSLIELAQKIKDQQILLIGSEHLVGNLHVLANQINENAKTFATYFPLPELNHHLLEGLQFPKSLNKNTVVLFFDSSLYYGRTRMRYPATKEILKKYKIKFDELKLNATSGLTQAGELLLWGSYLSFYLAIFNKLNPSLIPNVNFLKKKIGH